MKGEDFWAWFPPSWEGGQKGIVSSPSGCSRLWLSDLETAATSFSSELCWVQPSNPASRGAVAQKADAEITNQLSRHLLNKIINLLVDQALLSWVSHCLQTKYPNRYTGHLTIFPDIPYIRLISPCISRLIFIEGNFDLPTSDQKPSCPIPSPYTKNKNSSSFTFQDHLFPFLQWNFTSWCFVHMTCNLLLLHGVPILGCSHFPSIYFFLLKCCLQGNLPDPLFSMARFMVCVCVCVCVCVRVCVRVSPCISHQGQFYHIRWFPLRAGPFTFTLSMKEVWPAISVRERMWHCAQRRKFRMETNPAEQPLPQWFTPESTGTLSPGAEGRIPGVIAAILDLGRFPCTVVSCSVVSDSLWPHGQQHTRLPCPSSTPAVCIESVMPSNYLILCCPLLLPPSIFPSIRVFSNESAKALELQL